MIGCLLINLAPGTIEVRWLDIPVLRIKDLDEDEQGAYGHYRHLGRGLGAKVLKRGGLKTAQIEYLLNLYVQSHSTTRGMTSEVVACGTALVQIRGNWKSRPVIWMKHIDGINVYDHACNLGWQINPDFSRADAIQYGYASESMVPVIYRMCEIVDALKEVGYSGWDHETDCGNFMLLKNQTIVAIDFAPEKIAGSVRESKTVLKKIYGIHSSALEITLPIDYLPQMIAEGIISHI